MSSTHISINGTGSRHNQQLRAFIDQLQKVVDDSARLKAIFDQAAAGSDWEALADLLDLPSAGDAEAIYNLFGSANAELHDSFIPQLLSRAG